MKKFSCILIVMMALASFAFADGAESLSADSSKSSLPIDVGVMLDGGYGQWNVKLKKDHISAPEFGVGISSLFSFGNFAVRASLLGKYQAAYVSEGTQATINEGFWRLGGGIAARYQMQETKGFFTELGLSALIPLKNEVILCEGMSEEKAVLWKLGSKTEVPLELAVGYRIPLGPVSLDASLFGSYDLAPTIIFTVNGKERKARAWNVGARFTLWAVRF